MNKLRRTRSSILVLLLCLITMGAFGQKQTKIFNETFTLANESVLDINTSHTDIEFETWNKNQVVIKATIELEGATDEEAADYFDSGGFEILGNSKKVTITNGVENTWFFRHAVGGAQNFHFEMPEMPEMPEMDAFEFDFDLKELKNMPLMPMNPAAAFDHEAFEKDGEKYLKKWQKEFQKGFDKEHVRKLEEWGERMVVRQSKIQKKHARMGERLNKLLEERAEKLSERRSKMADASAKKMNEYQKRRARLIERSVDRSANYPSRVVIINGDSISANSKGGPNVFYSSANGESKNFKVKKSIKVKMPKSMKINMNVRHGEVKLAENTKNINATLSHSNLVAVTIDGDKTIINASYSPVSVQRWNYGQLQANYSKKIDLKKVMNLRLNATSSDVTIDKLLVNAFIKNDFGPLHINSIGDNFKEIDISLQNAELNCTTAKVPFTIYVNGTSSKLTCPADITLNRTKNGPNTINKGFQGNENAKGSIVIHSNYSEVVLD